MGTYQEYWKKVSLERGYNDDVMTLTLGLCEEVGEVAKAVNLMNPLYVVSGHVVVHDLQHELMDCINYICAIATAADIELEI